MQAQRRAGEGGGRRRRPGGIGGAAVLLGLAALAGCADGGPGRAPIACPQPAIPADAADLTRYRPGPIRDLTTLEFDARLNGLEGGCRAGRRGDSVEMQITPIFLVDRGAAAEGRAVDLLWKVAVLDARTDDPLGEPRLFRSTAVFRPNETRATFNGQSATIVLPVNAERRVTDYRVLVFLQLTEEELAMNRRRGPR